VSAPARDRADSKLPRRFWIYMAGVGLIAAGYADFPLIAYHFARESVFAEPAIPAVFALAMGVDALAALWLGPIFDRRGISVLAFVAVASAAAAPLLFLGRAPAALAGAALWGLGMGAWESVMKAATAAMAPAERRGSAFGVFGAVFGITWFLGSVILGALYSVSLPALVICSAGLQLAAVPVFLVARAADGH
jgi:MFS family permease